LESTFHDLGIPFPLFEAPVTDATDYENMGRCAPILLHDWTE
jgi:hypothetical protein